MIISASYKTDIPAFYGEWFINRLNAGYCKARNAFNNKPFEIDLSKRTVDGFVFWTKNAKPFREGLYEVARRSYPFIMQYTINGYPRELENRVVDYQSAIENFISISREYGPHTCVWRYDPIIFSDLTDEEFHIRRFSDIAARLSGYTDEVVFSFVQMYRKTKGSLGKLEAASGYHYHDGTESQKIYLMNRFVEIAKIQGIRVNLCSQPELLALNSNVGEAKCVDAARIQNISGNIVNAKLRGSRSSCGCYESKDIGEYDTCPHGCIYCYAVRSRDRALGRYKTHDPKSEFLFEEPSLKEAKQPSLFDLA